MDIWNFEDLRHMSISEHEDTSKTEIPARRVEIFTGAGRRRNWTADEQAAIVAYVSRTAFGFALTRAVMDCAAAVFHLAP
jgi:hypothetical protein